MQGTPAAGIVRNIHIVNQVMTFIVLSLDMLGTYLAKIRDIGQITIEQIQFARNRRFFHDMTVYVPHLCEPVDGMFRFGFRCRFEHGAQRSVLQGSFGYAGI